MRPIHSFEAHVATINGIAADADGTLFTCADDCTFACWIPTGDSEYRCTLRQWLRSEVGAICWEPTKRWLIVGNDDGLLQVFTISPDYSQCNEEFHVSAHTDRITAIVVDIAHGMIVTGGRDKLVRAYDLQSQNLTTGPIRDAWITCLAYDATSQRVFVGSYAHSIQILDVSRRLPQLRAVLTGHEASVRCLAYDPVRRYLFSGSFDEQVCVWDVGQPGQEAFSTLLARLDGHKKKVKSLTYDSGSQTIVSAGEDGHVIYWNSKSNEIEEKFLAHPGAAVTCLCPMQNQRLLATASKDDRVITFPLPPVTFTSNSSGAEVRQEDDIVTLDQPVAAASAFLTPPEAFPAVEERA